MATASGGHHEMSDCVQPKAKNNHDIEDIRNKAYIPEELPKDFLRVVLDKKQLDEQNDKELAHRLQYGQLKYPFNNFSHQLTPARSRSLSLTLGRGRLQIDLIEAKLVKNYGFTKMDPYVRVKIANKVYETQTDYGSGKNPKWNKTIMCYLPHDVDMISIEIFDEKSFTTDELVAFVKYPFPDALFQGVFQDNWIPLSGKSGEQKEGQINIRMHFTPMENLPHDPLQINPYQNPIKSQESTSSSSSASSQISPQNQQRLAQIPPELMRQVNQIKITDDDLKNIQEMFPSFDTETIKSLLESHHGNKEATIEALLQMS